MNSKLSLLAIPLLTSLATVAAEKPNVLFIMTDQQSHNMMSCTGNTWLKTPNMDKLAAMGVRFDKTWCANPVCMPSRFSLLTGHYASGVGVKENTRNFNAEKVEEIISSGSLGKIFSEAGYNCLYSGKTHLYGTGNTEEYGFKLNGKDPYEGPSAFAEKVLPELAGEKNGQPFLLFLSFLNPHDICYKAGFDRRYPDKLSPENARETTRLLNLQKSLSPAEYAAQVPPRASNTSPVNGELHDMVSMDIECRSWRSSQFDLYNWMYHRLTESVDQQVGRVLEALEASGLMDNTIIVFTSDHGEMNGAHNLILKNVMFEECQRVPFIFAGKGIRKNHTDKTTLVCNGLDFLPTVCDLAGMPVPKGLPGISLKPFLTGEGIRPERKYIITESYNANQITDGRYKYTVYELPGYPELLTDLEANPGETINYAGDTAYASIKAGLRKLLMADLDKRKLTPLPADRTIENIRAKERAASANKIKNSEESD